MNDFPFSIARRRPAAAGRGAWAQRLPAGALVAQVLEEGPAARGGLQVGDVILSLNGQPIVMSADLPHLVGALKPGEQAALEVVREGERKTIKLAIGALPEEGEEVALGAAEGVERSSNRLGVSVVELSGEQKKGCVR